jgi:hypothetical protein
VISRPSSELGSRSDNDLERATFPGDDGIEFLTRGLFSNDDVTDLSTVKSFVEFSLELVAVAVGFMNFRKSLFFLNGVEG